MPSISILQCIENDQYLVEYPMVLRYSFPVRNISTLGGYVNKSDLVNALAEKMNIPMKTSDTIIDTIFGSMSKTLIAGDRIEVRGFGSWMVKEYDGYKGRNPKDGRVVEVKSKKLPFFKAGKDMKERVDSL
jgi:integration host factor subunit beta